LITSYGCSGDAGDEGAIMRPFGADTDFGRLTSHTGITNIDIIATVRKV